MGTEAMKGKRILVVGGGESASDIANEVCEVAKETYMSVRNGVWFHQRTVGAYQPADIIFTKHMRTAGNYESIPVWMGRTLFIELMWGKGGSGVPEWQPRCGYLNGFINKSRELIPKVAIGKIQAKAETVRVEGKRIWFKAYPHYNETQEEADRREVCGH